ncbi:MAG: two-component regulator propeller domain-containing protein, partial [Rhodothermales bacterium]|nr:two-component regulator propeller domain-containing protein [Rhodothermales bacterium]
MQILIAPLSVYRFVVALLDAIIAGTPRDSRWEGKAVGLLIVLVLCLPAGAATAQEPAQAPLGAPPPMQFEVYGVQEGLPEPMVYDLLQDRFGYIWVGTQMGFARFDGVRFHTVALDENAPPLRSFKVLAEAPDGDIWAGEWIVGGLVHYDRQTGDARHYLPGQGLSEPEVRAGLVALQDGRVAAFTTDPQERSFDSAKCLDLLDPATGTSTPARTGLDPDRMPGYDCDPLLLHWSSVALEQDWGTLGPVLQDRRGRLWIGAGGGLYHLDPGADTLTIGHTFIHRPYPAAALARLDALLRRRAPLAALTSVGSDVDTTAVFELERATRVLLVGAGELTLASAYDVGWLEGVEGDTLWAMDLVRSAWGGGRSRNRLVVDTLTLAPGRYRARYRSDGGWDASDWRARPAAAPDRPDWWGLQVLPLSASETAPPVTADLVAPERDLPLLASAFLEARDGTVWIGTMRGELYRYDPSAGAGQAPAADRYARVPFAPPDRFGFEGARVRALHEDDEGQIWVGVDGRGLYRVDPRTGRARHYPIFDQRDPDVWRRADWIYRTYSMASGSDGTLWAGTGGGLFHLDPRTGGFNLYGRTFEANVPLGHRVWKLLRDAQGTLWAGTLGFGFARLDEPARAIRVLTHTEEESPDLPPRRIEGMIEAADGTIWVGSDRGLMHYDPATGTLTEPDLGAFGEVLSGENVPLLAEPDGALWVINRARRELYRY